MIDRKLSDIDSCVLIPTYNNDKTLKRVIDGVLVYSDGEDVIVINDGATDNTKAILSEYGKRIIVINCEKNKGKGNALKLGFREAIKRGFTNAISIDSDGQHYPDDITLFIEEALAKPGTLLMGSRNMGQEGVPGKSSFGNKFSNFWFRLETGIDLPDTQTGFRLYPLKKLSKIKLFTTKFETEIEVIVKMAWRGVDIKPVDIRVKYDPDERVSHFRPFKDFTRISILNTYFVILTFLWYLPKRIILSAKKKDFWIELKNNLFKPDETPLRKALSIGFGLFMGIVPIWGFQLLIGIPLAVLFRLNKVLFIAAANISIPPMIPIIILGSFYFGRFFYPENSILPDLSTITLETIHINFLQYCVGALLLALVAGVVGFSASYISIQLFKKSK